MTRVQQKPGGGVLIPVALALEVRDLDEELLAALGRDLDSGFARLVETHQSIVYSLLARMGERLEDAEDLTAETFLRAWRALRGYDQRRIAELKLRPWLVTIALNVMRNSRRDAARRPRTAPFDEQRHERADRRGAPDELATAKGEGRELAALLSQLPVRQRSAVVLRHVVELPIAEIAEILRCPEGTVRSDVTRGLTRLRAAYDGSAMSGTRKTNRKGARR